MASEAEFSFVFLLIAIILIGIKVAEQVMDRLDQPRVLGEVILGIILGPSLLGIISLNNPQSNLQYILLSVSDSQIQLASEIIEFMAQVGVLFLLFEVGLEIEFDVLKKVGKYATGAAIGGIISPFVTGLVLIWFVVSFFNPIGFIPPSSSIIHVGFFLGAALTATSVGISIKVFIEMNQLNSRVARTVVGAAVIDDIISIILLTIATTYFSPGASAGGNKLIFILLRVLGFFLLMFIAYKFVLPRYIKSVADTTDRYLPLITGLFLIFFLGWLAASLQLAAIIGSFVAGLLINQDDEFVAQIKRNFNPITHWIVPFFFIGVGLRVDIFAVFNIFVLLLGISLAIIAILTKVIGGILGTYFISEFEWHESQLVGIALSARGEVTLIFAAEALALGAFSPDLFAAVILMIILNAIIIPPLLKYMYQYWDNRSSQLENQGESVSVSD